MNIRQDSLLVQNKLLTLAVITREILERMKFLEREAASPLTLSRAAKGLTEAENERVRQTFLELEERTATMRRIAADVVYTVDLVFDVDGERSAKL